MTNPRGTQLETAARNWLRENGWPYAKRITKEGALDPGDLSLGDGIPVTVECKNEKKINLAGGAKELADEMRNNGHDWGFTIHKKRGTTNVGDYYAVLPVSVIMDILGYAVEHRRLLRGDEPNTELLKRYDQAFVDNVERLESAPPAPRRRVIPRLPAEE